MPDTGNTGPCYKSFNFYITFKNKRGRDVQIQPDPFIELLLCVPQLKKKKNIHIYRFTQPILKREINMNSISENNLHTAKVALQVKPNQTPPKEKKQKNPT